MKVIDLLNKIANGETTEEIMFQYNNGYKEYANINTLFDRFTINEENLNTEIEIIEEDKKIKKLEEPILTEKAYDYIKLLKHKQDEIIDYINGDDKE